jgi:hypothetical protein
MTGEKCSDLDPDSLSPDPAFYAECDPDLIHIQDFDDKTLKKYTAQKRVDIFFLNRNLLIPRLPLRMSKLQEKPSALKREHPAL